MGGGIARPHCRIRYSSADRRSVVALRDFAFTPSDDGLYELAVSVLDNKGAKPASAQMRGSTLRNFWAMGCSLQNTFFDKELNAYFCHVAGDSNDDGVMWVYRHKK